MENENIDYFFTNIIAKTYLNMASRKGDDVQSNEVKEIYLIKRTLDKNYLIGKTEKIYFVIVNEGDDYNYSVILMHEDPLVLLSNYKQNSELLNGQEVNVFWNQIYLNNVLQRDLKKKDIPKKIFKI